MNWFDIIKKDPWDIRPINMHTTPECCETAREDTREAYVIKGWGINQHILDRILHKLDKPVVDGMSNCKWLLKHIKDRSRNHGDMGRTFNDIYRKWDACERGDWLDADTEGMGTAEEFREKWE